MYVATIGSQNTACSKLYNFYVQDVDAPKVYTEKGHYPTKANVKISWDAPLGTTSYWIDIWKENDKIVSKQLANETEYPLGSCEDGNYTVYVTAMKNTSAMSEATNEPYGFSVGQIDAPKISLEREHYAPDSDVKVVWDIVDDATCYWIDVWNGNSHFLSEQLSAATTSYTIKKCAEGNYAVFVTAIEVAGGASSLQSEIKNFYVGNVEAPIVCMDKHLYFDKDDVLISWITPNGATSYWIDVWYNGEQILSKQLGYENAYSLKQCKAGEYSVIITAFENTGGLTSASSEKMKFDVILHGDCNANGKLDVADVVLLQKWLLAVPDTQFKNWQTADWYQDGQLDVLDFCLLKRKLLND